MKVYIQNCNNIDSGIINIEENMLSIKYAINGTGKSTIGKAINAFVNKDEAAEKELTPYKYLDSETDKPNVTGIENINSVMIFNDDYVNKYTLQPNELIKNSFEVFIKTPEYDKHTAEIGRLLKSVSITFKAHPELDELLSVFSDFEKDFGKSSNQKLSKSSAISKGIGNGNKIVNIPSGLEKYKPYLTETADGTNFKWLRWQLEGKKYLEMTAQCPYCTSDVTNTKDMILKVEQEYNSKNVEHYNRIIEEFDEILPYLSDSASRIIIEIKNNIDGIDSKQEGFLYSIKDEVSRLYSALSDLRNINYFSLQNVDKIADEIKSYKIELKYYPNFNSDKMSEKVSVINSVLDELIVNASRLQGEVNQQKARIKKTINENKKEINQFLSSAGYNYEVDIIDSGNKDYRMILKPVNIDIEVLDVSNHLSYGEKNALALIMFKYDVLREKPDLIILDDPISSFDGNKKFAVIQGLFFGKKNLLNKTVLLLTHEFSTVIDIISVKRGDFNPLPTAAFLSTDNGELTETEIKKSDIESFNNIAKRNIQSADNDFIKLIYLRRLLEFNGADGDDLSWQLLSNFFKSDRIIPRFIYDTENRTMTDEEVAEAEIEIGKFIPGFNYNDNYKNRLNLSFLLDLYNNAKNNYEKLCMYRVIYCENNENKIIRKFVNEVFHIENEYIYQLDPMKYNTIPQFVIDECNKDIDTVKISNT